MCHSLHLSLRKTYLGWSFAVDYNYDKSNMNDFLKSIETDLNIPPWRYRKDYDDDDMPPF